MCQNLNLGSNEIKNSIGSCYTLKGAEGSYSVSFPKGRFRIELWGSSAGLTDIAKLPGGSGAYISAELILKSPQLFYFLVGTAGGNSDGKTPCKAGFNGGAEGGDDDIGNNCATGGSGGATDMRTELDDLKSRILVSGAGGSSGC